jgi:hypothetical protein
MTDNTWRLHDSKINYLQSQHVPTGIDRQNDHIVHGEYSITGPRNSVHYPWG